MLQVPKDITRGRRAFLYAQSEFSVNAMLRSAGYRKHSEGTYDFSGLQRGERPFAIVQLTLSGAGYLRYEQTESEVLPGSLMLLTIPHDHRYSLPKSSSHWEFLYVCFEGDEVMRCVREVIKHKGPLFSVSPTARVVAQMLRILRLGQADELETPWAASAEAYALAMSLLEHLDESSRDYSNRPGPVRRAIAYLENNWKTEPSVEELAAHVGYTRSHFSRVFKAAEGIGPGQYLDRLRLTRAAEMLQDSQLSIAEIAGACGFRDAHYFGKAFKRHFGSTPGAVRKSGII